MIKVAHRFLELRGYHVRPRSCSYLVILLARLLTSSGFAQDHSSSPLDQIQWAVGPARVPLGPLGGVAHIDIPPGYRFADSVGTRLWNQATHNPPDDSYVGVLIPPLDNSNAVPSWYIRFSYDDSGHVQDDEKASLDKDSITAMLDAISKATEDGNVVRASHGWQPLHVIAWQQEPFYDELAHHLTWAIAASQQEGSTADTVNYNSRVLGRTGVMSVNLVLSPSDLAGTLPSYNTVVAGITFDHGSSYAEFRDGDKVAKYGLIALITGGATVVAVKSWGVLVKIGAVFLAMVLAGLAKAASKVKSLFARASPEPATAGAKESAPPGSAAGVIKCPICGQANRVRSDAGSAPSRCGRCKATLTK